MTDREKIYLGKNIGIDLFYQNRPIEHSPICYRAERIQKERQQGREWMATFLENMMLKSADRDYLPRSN